MNIWNRNDSSTTNDKPGSPPAGGEPTAKPESVWQLPAKLPDYWYQTPGNLWWLKNDEGTYTPYPSTHVRDLLLDGGVRGSIFPGERLAPTQRTLLALRQQQSITWAGELAGFHQGVVDMQGNRVLITKSPSKIKPKKGNWSALQKLLTELFGTDVNWFYGWMKSALRSLYAGPPFRPGQCFVMAGKKGCGKSLLQGVITELLGGRAAKPFEWLMGETGFNKDVFRSEHLMLEDEASSIDIRKRTYFGQKLKNLVANDLKRCHPKGIDALYLQAFWRVTMSLNDNQESLMVVPPITEDLEDKIIMCQVNQATFNFGDDDVKGRTAYRQQLTAELPAFVDWLYSWRIPARMADQRYGVKGYQCAALMDKLHEMQPEFRLLSLIDHLKPWGVDNEPFKGPASALQDILEEKDKLGRVARLLSWHSACGQFLARLARACPERVKVAEREHNQAIWLVLPRS